MNTISKLSLVSALALLVVAGPSLAQTAEAPAPQGSEQMAEDGQGGGQGRHHGRDHGGRHGGGRGGKHRLMIIDANADGIIGDDEAAAMAQAMFQRQDRDGNGALSLEEFTSNGHGKRWFNWGNSEDAAAIEKSRAERFAALDADKDKTVTIAEFFADAKTKLASADTDKDGKVTPWEFRALIGKR